MKKFCWIFLGVFALSAAAWEVTAADAQAPVNSAGVPAKSPPVVNQDFPRAPGDPDAAARGKQTFSVNCAFCHGSDARGGEGGPNLLRSPIVLNDQNGELVAAIVSNGRIDKGMPKFNLPTNTIADISAYLHSVNVGVSSAQFDPKSVLVGNAAAGKAYFNGQGRCTACHSIKKDLAGVGSKYDPKTLQDKIFTGGGDTGMMGIPSPTAPPRTVVVKLSAEQIEGRLVSIDDFNLTLVDNRGNRRTIRREGNFPSIQITNPLQAHLDCVRTWEDRDLHDLTAYLVTLK